jgi:Cu(I)/Ag(I) efflux system membrane protein CusA/SilA
LSEIQKVSIQIERTLADFPDTRSAFAERTTGGYFLDFTVDRQAAARYGLRVDDINDVIQTAIGGQTIATTVEGRERYPISVRYSRDFRNDLDALKRVLIPLPALAETLNSPAELAGASNPPMGITPHIPI